jgi:hypothetical protein
MTRFSDVFHSVHATQYRDTFSLKIEAGATLEITNEHAVMPQYYPACVNIISFVIAKSVALERIEEQVDLVLDEMEDVISLLERGKLALPDRKLARLASSILNFKYNLNVASDSSARFGNVDKSFCLCTGLCQKLFPLFRRLAALQHFAENSVRILCAFVGPLGLCVVYPRIHDDFTRTVIAKKKAVLLEKLCTKPMFVFFAKSTSLAIFRTSWILRNFLER